jgi:hypothetical protein
MFIRLTIAGLLIGNDAPGLLVGLGSHAGSFRLASFTMPSDSTFQIV